MSLFKEVRINGGNGNRFQGQAYQREVASMAHTPFAEYIATKSLNQANHVP